MYFIAAFCSNTTATYGIFPMKSPQKRTQKRAPAYISAHFDRFAKNKKGRPARGGLYKFHVEIPDQSGITDPEKSHVTVWGVEALS